MGTRIGIIGVGAIGSIVGGLLTKAGQAGRLAGNSCMILGIFAVALPSILTFWR